MRKQKIKCIAIAAGIWILHVHLHLQLLLSAIIQSSVTAFIPTIGNYPEDGECQLLDGDGNNLQFLPEDGAVIFSVTIFGKARVPNVIQQLSRLLVEIEIDDDIDKFLSENDDHSVPSEALAMIAVSGNETLVPLMEGLSTEFFQDRKRLIVANMEQDYGPISRVAAADICFPSSKDYTIVVGDDDVVYNPRAVFLELPNYLRRVVMQQQKVLPIKHASGAAMVGYRGMHWTYPFVNWGSFVHGTAIRHHVRDVRWEMQHKDAADENNKQKQPHFCSIDSDKTSSLCNDIIPTGLLECYGLVAFHRSAINPKLYEKHLHPELPSQCFFGDDFWLAYYAYRMNIPRFVVRSYVTKPSAALIKQLPQPDGSVGSKAGGGGNMPNYRTCEKTIYSEQGNCSWCI